MAVLLLFLIGIVNCLVDETFQGHIESSGDGKAGVGAEVYSRVVSPFLPSSLSFRLPLEKPKGEINRE